MAVLSTPAQIDNHRRSVCAPIQSERHGLRGQDLPDVLRPHRKRRGSCHPNACAVATCLSAAAASVAAANMGGRAHCESPCSGIWRFSRVSEPRPGLERQPKRTRGRRVCKATPYGAGGMLGPCLDRLPPAAQSMLHPHIPARRQRPDRCRNPSSPRHRHGFPTPLPALGGEARASLPCHAPRKDMAAIKAFAAGPWQQPPLPSRLQTLRVPAPPPSTPPGSTV